MVYDRGGGSAPSTGADPRLPAVIATTGQLMAKTDQLEQVANTATQVIQSSATDRASLRQWVTSLAAMLDDLQDRMTTQEARPSGLSKTAADALYQPAGAYAPAGSYLTQTTADQRYQPLGSYASAGSYLTQAAADLRYQPTGSYQPAGSYLTQLAADARYLTPAAGDLKYAPVGALTQTAADVRYVRPPLPASPQSRQVSKAMALITVGSAEIAVTWTPALPSTAYLVDFDLPTTLVGVVDCDVKQGSRTTTGFTMSFRNMGLVSIAAGQTIDIFVIHPGS